MIGADIVDVRRIERAIEDERFCLRVFTEGERAYAATKRDGAQTLAGIYAAKEAIAKLSGRGLCYDFHDTEIVCDEFGAPKVIVQGRAKELFGGEVFVSISHEKDYAFAVASYERVDFKPVLPGKEIVDGDLALLPRLRNTHKGNYGRVYVIGGSSLMPGAPLIAAEAAARSGAGLTTLCIPASQADAYRSRVKEIMLCDLPDAGGKIAFDEAKLDAIIGKADAIAIGMGMGNDDFLPEILCHILENFSGVAVCDADALNAFARTASIPSHKCKLILTPHVGEFKRLSEAFGVQSAEDLALKVDGVVACKSAYTVVTNGITTFNVTAGTAAMAKGGSGDTLTGIIAAYACVTDPLTATALACHHFGRCGEKAARLKGENAVIASDLIAQL